MKFNLKNRPRGHGGAMGYDSFDYKAVKEWFEGFEKELRLRKAVLESCDIAEMPLGAELKRIKEILGE